MDLHDYTAALELFINESDYEAPSHSWTTVEVLAAYGQYQGYKVSELEDWEAEAEEAYQGSCGSDEDFAREMADDLGLLSAERSWPFTNIDWEGAAADLMEDYFENGGYYFRNS